MCSIINTDEDLFSDSAHWREWFEEVVAGVRQALYQRSAQMSEIAIGLREAVPWLDRTVERKGDEFRCPRMKTMATIAKKECMLLS